MHARWLGVCALVLLAGYAAGRHTDDKRSDLIEDTLASSVQVFVERDDGRRRAGSGVALGSTESGETLILTSGHILEPVVAQDVFVVDPRSGARVAAEVIALDGEIDAAVLTTQRLQVRPVSLQPTARLGQDVLVVSFPWGRQITLAGGLVSRIAGRTDGTPRPLEGPVALIDASVSYGTSGGGVFDSENGNLVGIVRGYRTAKLSLPGTAPEGLSLPIAGETTVVSTADILCLLGQAPELAATLTARHEAVRDAACPAT